VRSLIEGAATGRSVPSCIRAQARRPELQGKGRKEGTRSLRCSCMATRARMRAVGADGKVVEAHARGPPMRMTASGRSCARRVVSSTAGRRSGRPFAAGAWPMDGTPMPGGQRDAWPGSDGFRVDFGWGLDFLGSLGHVQSWERQPSPVPSTVS
jgi:hypothetical protein